MSGYRLGEVRDTWVSIPMVAAFRERIRRIFVGALRPHFRRRLASARGVKSFTSGMGATAGILNVVERVDAKVDCKSVSVGSHTSD